MSESNAETPRLLYLAAVLPKRSETFVYREILALRERGVRVEVASVHQSERGLGEEALERIADEAVLVYAPGAWRLLRDALGEVVDRPLRAARVLFRGVWDGVTAADVKMDKRPKIVWQSLAGMALARRVRGRGVQHVHAHMAHVPTTIAMAAAAQLNVGFSFTGHAVDLFRDRVLLRRKLRRAAFVAAISRWHQGFYRSLVPRPEADYPLVRCGVDSAWSAASPERHAPGTGTSLLAVARLVPKKGLDVLLRATAQLIKTGSTLQLEVVGEGPEEDSLQALASELQIDDRVVWHGAQDNHVVNRMMGRATLFVLPCQVDAAGDRDGIPVVLIEAMACGRCVVTGDLPAIRELVIHDQTGWLVPPGDVDTLGQGLAMLLREPERRRRLGRAGRRHVEQAFSLTRNVARLQEAFRRAVDADQSP